MQGAANFRNQACSGKQSFLPPKCPFPSFPPSYGDYGFVGAKGTPKAREGNRHHQRTSSESFLVEEQPSWLDDLLNEPETPVKRGAHRRSSSDSFAYLDASSMYSGIDSLAQEEHMHRGIGSTPQWGTQEFDHVKDGQRVNCYSDQKTFARPQINRWDSGMNMANYLRSAQPPIEKGMGLGSSSALREPDMVSYKIAEKLETEEPSHDLGPHSKQSQSETDTKRVKQQFAQRSRVRKLQYIGELERNVQALQAEGMEVTAELEFVDQQNLILNMENQTLKQRLDSLAQEHLIKKFQQEMLEREISRLRMVFQQHQQKSPQPTASHSRSNSRDLESHLSNLSLKSKDANSGRDPVTGPLRI